MATELTYIDDWTNRAFELAWFLHRDRETAKQIVIGALCKLETASNAQFKRYYYTPTGRADTAATRSRVSLNDLQLLQRLVFIESESFEKDKEASQTVDRNTLITFFIKHLVRISLKRNSFYVTLGITRILHSYTTNDAIEIYNVVIQDPDRVHDDYYFRSRKGLLMKELRARFGEELQTVRGNRGEERFLAESTDAKAAETVRESLKFFTPWETECSIPADFDPIDNEIESFKFDGQDPDREHRIEVNRIHATLHPSCFHSLTNALSLSPPEEKMEIPKFMSTSSHYPDDDRPAKPPHLETSELEQIKNILASRAETRRTVSAGLLRIVVDGRETARIDLGKTAIADFDLDETAELIEVTIVEKHGDVALATHLLNFDELQNGPDTQSITLEGGQEVSFNIVASKDEYGEISGFKCGVQYAKTRQVEQAAGIFSRIRSFFAESGFAVMKPVFAALVILFLLLSVWLVLRQTGTSGDVVKNQGPGEPRPANVTPEVQGQNTPANRKEPANRPDPNKTSNPEVQGQNSSNSSPLQPKSARLPTKPGAEEQVLRVPVRGSNVREIGKVRSAENIDTGKSLGQIRRIFLEFSGDEDPRPMVDRISSELKGDGAFELVDNATADAALKISVSGISIAKKVTVIVRLVNAEGFVIYPDRKGVTAWKYIGEPDTLAKKVARDLAAAKRKSR